MNDPIWIGSAGSVKTGQDALKHLKNENDVKYWDDTHGIVRVDQERWKKAQQYELTTWMNQCLHASSDRDTEHAELFDNYSALPTELGDTLEVGCGPFTQTRYLLQNGKVARSITLSDPLIEQYKNHPHCAYWHLKPSPSLIPLPAEQLHRLEKFDTVICINVLEHVRDADQVLRNLLLALRPNGILVMGERTYDDLNIEELYDVGHPIRIKSTVFDKIKDSMEMLYDNGGYFIAKKA